MSRPGITTERLVALCFIAALALNPPLLGLFDTGGLVGGMPTLYIYLFVAWAVLIILIAWLVESPSGRQDLSEAESDNGPDYGLMSPTDADDV